MTKALLITNKEDITVDFIADKLNQKSLNYFRLNTEEIGNEIDIIFNPNKNSLVIRDIGKNSTINLSDFHSVYFRRPQLPDPPKDLTYGEQIFFNREISTLLTGIYHFLSEKKWLNHPIDISYAENKIKQLLVAKELGFIIPDSLITNHSHSAKYFLEKNNNSVFKPLRSGQIPENSILPKILYTNDVDNHFINNIDRIKSFPTYFQKKVHKKYDIRVTVVNQQVFPAAIDSQLFPDSKTDWRAYSDILPHAKIELPDSISSKCLALTNHFKLNFAAIDLILDNNDNYYFLEINPNGQWAWIELLLSYPISNTIIDFLFN